MGFRRLMPLAVCLFAVSLIAGCGGATRVATVQTPSHPPASPSPAAVPSPTTALSPTATPLPTAPPAPQPDPMQLVLLHTNDNWGETEPCG
jgi:2',3'-cyclic-nucleotide 2'-phosphodiesterase (5'-nucleotidase family)